MTKNILHYNILRKLRKQQGLTIVQLAEQAGISDKAVYNAECGLYEAPLNALTEYFTKNFDITHSELTSQYNDFRAMLQARTKEKYSETDYFFTSTDCNKVFAEGGKKLSPIADFRLNTLVHTVSEFRFCFLINPGTHFKLEAGTSRSVPADIHHSLKACGAPMTFLEELNVRTKRFRPDR